jgi:VWFA-related protein
MRPLRPRAVRTSTLFLLFLASALFAQDVQIKSRVELVEVSVSVKASNGTFASGLTKEAFTIREAGKVQKITDFSIDPVPISAAVLVDTGVTENALSRVKTSFPALLGAFADDDEVAIYRFEKTIEKITDFTSDHSRLNTAIAKLTNASPSSGASSSGPFSALGPVINGVPIIPGVQSAGKTSVPPTKVLHDAVFQAAEDLGARDIHRRKIVILISDGQNHNSLHNYDTALARLLTHSVQVFTVGIDTTVFQRLHSALGSYAKDTGGESWYPETQSDLEICYPLSTDGARNQYVLTYVSSNKRPTTAKPQFREIKVQVALKDAQVRHKRGYYQAP